MNMPPPPPPGQGAPPTPGSIAPARMTSAPLHAPQKTAEEAKAERRRRRIAIRKLCSAPELLGIMILFFITLGIASSFEFFALLFGMTLLAIFGWIFMVNGDAIVATLILIGFGTLGTVFLADVGIDETSILWILPTVVIVAAETAMSYNHFRRRRGEISIRVAQTMFTNTGAVAVVSLMIAFALRALATTDGQVEWPWFATTVIILGACWMAGLILIRRSATPSDQRRFSPGRRMLPPPT